MIRTTAMVTFLGTLTMGLWSALSAATVTLNPSMEYQRIDGFGV